MFLIKKNYNNNKYFIYWILGNLITITAGISGWGLFIYLVYSIKFNIPYILFCSFFLIGPFIGGFITKYMYNHLPIYIYGTIGLIYEAGFLLAMSYGHEMRTLPFRILAISCLILTIPVSIFAGKLAMIIINLKLLNKNLL